MVFSWLTSNPEIRRYFLENIEESQILTKHDRAKFQPRFPIDKIDAALLANQHTHNLIEAWKAQGYFTESLEIYPANAEEWFYFLVPYIDEPGPGNIDPLLMRGERVAKFISDCQHYHLLPRHPGITTENISEWLHLFVPILTPTPVQLPPYIEDSWYWEHHYHSATAHWAFHGVPDAYFGELNLSLVPSGLRLWSRFKPDSVSSSTTPPTIFRGLAARYYFDTVTTPSPYGIKAIMVQTRARARGPNSIGAGAESSKYNCDAHPLDEVLSDVESVHSGAGSYEMQEQDNANKPQAANQVSGSFEQFQSLYTGRQTSQLRNSNNQVAQALQTNHNALLTQQPQLPTAQSYMLDADKLSAEEAFARFLWAEAAQRAVQHGQHQAIPNLGDYLRHVQAIKRQDPNRLVLLMNHANIHQALSRSQSHQPQAPNVAEATLLPGYLNHTIAQSPGLSYLNHTVPQSPALHARDAQQSLLSYSHLQGANTIVPSQHGANNFRPGGMYKTPESKQARMDVLNSVYGGSLWNPTPYSSPYANSPTARNSMPLLGGANNHQFRPQSVPPRYGSSTAQANLTPQVKHQDLELCSPTTARQNSKQPGAGGRGPGGEPAAGTTTKPVRKRRTKAEVAAASSLTTLKDSEAIDETKPSQYDLTKHSFPDIFDHHAALYAQDTGSDQGLQKILGEP